MLIVGQTVQRVQPRDTPNLRPGRLAPVDAETVAVLTDGWERCQARAAALGLTLTRDGLVFSPVPDCSAHLLPDSVTQRYRRLAERLHLDTHLHRLRHYSAIELIAAVLDIRTVDGRLGHGGKEPERVLGWQKDR